MADETARLLEDQLPKTTTLPKDGRDRSCHSSRDGRRRKKVSPTTVLPIALLSALAMAATAATQIYTFAELLCQDPRHCKSEETRKYSSSVASATLVASILSLAALGAFEKLAKRNQKAGLAVWIVVRSMSVGALVLGVSFRQIRIALSSQVFEGLASDNILHFNLNAIYVQEQDTTSIPRLVSTSTALYMTGISMSPSIASILPNYRSSFTMATVFFATALVYLLLGVRTIMTSQQPTDEDGRSSPRLVTARKHNLALSISTALRSLVSPLQVLFKVRISILPAIALLLYNAMQSYAFTAIMIQTSVKFGFSSRENGFLITIAHIVSAAYLLTIYFVAPAISRRVCAVRSGARELRGQRLPIEAYLALMSIAIQAISFALFALATQPRQVYAVVAFFSLGLTTPSFVKSYFVTLFMEDAAQAMASLAAMETIGSLISPLALGGMQTIWPDGKVFYIAAIVLAVAWVLLGLGMLGGILTVRPADDAPT